MLPKSGLNSRDERKGVPWLTFKRQTENVEDLL
jgi:hypothetical protein